MGKRGEEFGPPRFTSSVVGKQMAEVYDWMRAEKPTSVEIS